MDARHRFGSIDQDDLTADVETLDAEALVTLAFRPRYGEDNTTYFLTPHEAIALGRALDDAARKIMEDS